MTMNKLHRDFRLRLNLITWNWADPHHRKRIWVVTFDRDLITGVGQHQRLFIAILKAIWRTYFPAIHLVEHDEEEGEI